MMDPVIDRKGETLVNENNFIILLIKHLNVEKEVQETLRC